MMANRPHTEILTVPQIPVLMNRTPLHRHAVPHRGERFLQSRRAVDDEKRRPAQTAPDQIIENGAPGFGEFAAHVLDREQHLLAVLAHANHHKQRDRGGLAIQPHANNGAVEDKPRDRLRRQRARVPGVPIAFDLAPDPAHNVLAHGAAEQRCQRTPHSPRIGARKVGAGDQRVGGERATLISSQRLAVPLGGPAIGRLQPSARHGNLGLAKAAGQRARAAAVTMANDACRTGVVMPYSPISWASERSVQFAADERFDELTNALPHTALDRIKPVVEKMGGGFRCRLEKSVFVVTFVMAWSPFRRSNAG